MSKERETIVATIVATVFPCIVIGLWVPIVSSSVGTYAPAVAARPIVAIEAQSPLSSATPLAVLPTFAGTDSALDLQLLFYGYPKRGVPQSGFDGHQTARNYLTLMDPIGICVSSILPPRATH